MTYRFLEALRAAADFETAAVVTLRELSAICRTAARDSAHRDAEILRAMLHLRPQDGYRGLSVLERGADALSDPGAHESLLPSASVWRTVNRARAPVAVDVQLRTVQVGGGNPEVAAWNERPVDMNSRSSLRLLRRDATHLYVLPVFAPGGLVGMISIEAQSMTAMGLPFVWPACTAALEAVVVAAGPYVAALPRRPEPSRSGDALLPVVGATMAPIIRFLRAFSAEEETLLVRGETGTGKSRIARWIHAHSTRVDGPFEVLDLLSVPEETQMGELFGWQKGAFTGAVKDHRGFVARAEGGTLFIDEIDKLSLKAQAALLMLLEERRYRVLGDDGPTRDADLRFVVGTNVDLQASVADGTFREDLYYRINVLPVRLPALRERADEIGDWAAFMLQRRHRDRQGSGPLELTDAARQRLSRLPWPGNLRQLDNVMRRAYTLASLEGGPMVVDAPQIDAATAFDGAPALRAGGEDALYDAARALVAALATAQPPIDLEAIELGGALEGLLLGAAVLETGSREAAFTLLGKGDRVKNRNHHKVLKREWARLAELYAALGRPMPAGLEEVPG